MVVLRREVVCSEGYQSYQYMSLVYKLSYLYIW